MTLIVTRAQPDQLWNNVQPDRLQPRTHKTHMWLGLLDHDTHLSPAPTLPPI
jgi:hypothetical protein